MATDRTSEEDDCPSRRLRADAAGNRQRLLAAARRVFGRDGVAAPLTAVAEEAGVGIATLYRRFPDRDALVAEAYGDATAEFERLLDSAAADPDPWHAFSSMVVGMGELEARDRGFTHLLQATGLDAAAAERPGGVRQRGYVTAVDLINRGQQGGVLRPDLSPEDLPVLTFAIAGILEATRDDAPEAWRRHVALLLEGCRPRQDAAALPDPVSPRTLRRAMIRAARRRTGLA